MALDSNNENKEKVKFNVEILCVTLSRKKAMCKNELI